MDPAPRRYLLAAASLSLAVFLAGFAAADASPVVRTWVAVGQGCLVAVTVLVIRSRVRAFASSTAKVHRRGRVILDSLSEGVLGLDTDLVIVTANPAAARLLGIELDELIGRRAHDLLTCPETGGPAPLDLAAVIDDGEAISGTALCGSDERDQIAVETTITPVRADRAVVGAVQVLRDVQAEREALAALERNERSARAVIETASDAFVSIQADGRIAAWNHAAARMFGWPASEAIGADLADLLIPLRYREAHWIGLRRYLDSGRSRVLGQRLELQALHRDAREVPVELVIWRGEDEGGSPRFNAFLRDISDRVDSQRALLDRQRQMAQAEELAHIGSWVWDIVTDTVTWSPGMYRLTATPTSETPGFEPWAEAVHPDDRHRALEAVKAAVRGIAPGFEVEYRTLADDGGVGRHVAAGQIERDVDGSAVRVVGLIRDVSQEREAQRIREELTAVATHELKTPLTSIRGALSLIESGALGEDLPPALKEMIAVASRNAERLVDLANVMLDVERLSSHTIALDEERVELDELLRDAATGMEGLAHTRGVDLGWEDATGGAARLDRGMMMQVLTNLVSNAIKFSDPGQTVTISACPKGDSDLELQVRDRGRGIPVEQLRAVFERFRQVDPGDVRERSGSGLGLSIVEQIVRRHGGTVEALSDGIGTGTTMRITLPGRLLGQDGELR